MASRVPPAWREAGGGAGPASLRGLSPAPPRPARGFRQAERDRFPRTWAAFCQRIFSRSVSEESTARILASWEGMERPVTSVP